MQTHVQYFQFSSENAVGVFQGLREVNKLNSTVSISSKDHFAGNYCSLDLPGYEVYSLIDGKTDTAWANDHQGPDYSCFTISFKKHQFLFQNYMI